MAQIQKKIRPRKEKKKENVQIPYHLLSKRIPIFPKLVNPDDIIIEKNSLDKPSTKSDEPYIPIPTKSQILEAPKYVPTRISVLREISNVNTQPKNFSNDTRNPLSSQNFELDEKYMCQEKLKGKRASDAECYENSKRHKSVNKEVIPTIKMETLLEKGGFWMTEDSWKGMLEANKSCQTVNLL